MEASKELVKAIVKWLRERKKKGLKDPRLKVIVEGNVLRLNITDMKVLEAMLKKASEGKKRRKKKET